MQDECIREVIAKQEAHQMPVVSDGEFRRANFQDSFGQAVSGFDAAPSTWEPKAFYDGKVPFQRVESGPSGSGPAILNRRPVIERLRLGRNVALGGDRFSHQGATRPGEGAPVGPDPGSQRLGGGSARGG